MVGVFTSWEEANCKSGIFFPDEPGIKRILLSIDIVLCLLVDTYFICLIVANCLTLWTCTAYFVIPWMKCVHIISLFSLAHTMLQWTTWVCLFFFFFPFIFWTHRWILFSESYLVVVLLDWSKYKFSIIMGKVKLSFKITTNVHLYQ